MYYDKHVEEIVKDVKRNSENTLAQKLAGIFYLKDSQTIFVNDRYRGLIALSDKPVGRTGFIRWNKEYVEDVDEILLLQANPSRHFHFYKKQAILDTIKKSALKPLSARSRSNLVKLEKQGQDLIVSHVISDEKSETTEFALKLSMATVLSPAFLDKPVWLNERYFKQCLTFLAEFQKENPNGHIEISVNGALVKGIFMAIGRNENGDGMFKYILCPVNHN